MTASKDTVLRLAKLPTDGPTDFLIEPDAAARAAIATSLGIEGIRKLRFSGTLAPLGKRDWQLTAMLGATVVQSCVVTLAPVTSRIDEPVQRRYLSEMPEVDPGAEIEMPEDDSAEPLPETLDLAAVMTEALTLALPPYPRAPGAAIGEAVYTEPGKQALRDEDTKPFAGLSDLRAKLENKGE